MDFLLNLILAFYPATLIWYSVPADYLKKADSYITTPMGHFLLHLIIYGVIFFCCHMALNKFNKGGFLGRSGNFLGKAIALFLTLVLVCFVFYSILPGATVYATPPLVEDFVLNGPFPFLAVALPIVFLFFI